MKKASLILTLLLIVQFTQAQIITTVAGGGTAYPGDGGQATDAALSLPTWIALDSAGNIYISDHDHYRVRKVYTDGIISTIAGTGIAGFSGDGGPATEAQLNGSYGIAVDNFGNIFFSDNLRIRKIDTNGIINTIAGDGTLYGFNGDGIPATNANGAATSIVVKDGCLYYTDNANNRVRKIDTNGIVFTIAGTTFGIHLDSGDNRSATTVTLNRPGGIKIDCKGNIIFTEFSDKIRMIDTAGIISTIVGTGVAGFNGDGHTPLATQLNFPEDIAIDCDNNMFISDFNNERIRMVTYGADTVVTTFAGTGIAGYNGTNIPATSAQICGPFAMMTDKYGSLYFVDGYNGLIRYIINSVGVGNIVSNELKIQVFPNPSEGNINVNIISHFDEPFLLTIFDMMGRSIFFTSGLTNTSKTLCLNTPGGIYTAQIKIKDEIITKKIIIK